MKAEEARKTAHTVNTDHKTNQMGKIMGMIEQECKKGKYEMWFYETLHPDVKQELHDNGYACGMEQFDRNETMIKISW